MSTYNPFIDGKQPHRDKKVRARLLTIFGVFLLAVAGIVLAVSLSSSKPDTSTTATGPTAPASTSATPASTTQPTSQSSTAPTPQATVNPATVDPQAALNGKGTTADTALPKGTSYLAQPSQTYQDPNQNPDGTIKTQPGQGTDQPTSNPTVFANQKPLSGSFGSSMSGSSVNPDGSPALK